MDPPGSGLHGEFSVFFFFGVEQNKGVKSVEDSYCWESDGILVAKCVYWGQLGSFLSILPLKRCFFQLGKS